MIAQGQRLMMNMNMHVHLINMLSSLCACLFYIILLGVFQSLLAIGTPAFIFLSKTYQEHPWRRFVQDPHSNPAGRSIEIRQPEAFGSLYTRRNSHKPDPSSDLEI